MTPTPSCWVSLGALFIVILSATLGPGGASSTPAPGCATRSAGSRSAPSTRSAAPCSAGWPCCWSPGRSAWPSPARASAASRPWCASRRCSRRSTRRCPPLPTGVLQAFNNVVGTTLLPALPRAVRAGADRGGRARHRSGCSPTPTWSAPRPAFVKIRSSNSCGRGIEGSGFLFAPDRVMTNAHVVAGVDEPEVEIGGSAVAATSSTTTPTSTSP